MEYRKGTEAEFEQTETYKLWPKVGGLSEALINDSSSAFPHHLYRNGVQ